MYIWEDSIIKTLIEYLRKRKRQRAASSSKDQHLSAPRFVFVCGKHPEAGEETIRDIAIKDLLHYKKIGDYGNIYNNVLCVVSEDLYQQDLAEDVFTFEKMLAEISQRIIIISESAGTFCELGAFAMDDECCKKTIVINEDLDEYKDSFITRGPIKMLELIDEDSVIFYNGINQLKRSPEFFYRLEQIANEELRIPINSDVNNINLRSFIYELANVIEMFQPLSKLEIEIIYKIIMDMKGRFKIANSKGHKINDLTKVLSLMEKMNIIDKSEGLYFLREAISCYNVMFNISRKEYNDFRIKYLNRIDKLDSERIEIL